MAAIGLVPELTLEAARRACLGAGAKVVCSLRLRDRQRGRPRDRGGPCDIVLLCGGTDGGDKRVITHNARMLAQSGVECPILVAGNRVVADAVRETLESEGKRVYRAGNVLPTLDTVEVEPAQALIREIFIAHITHAKGLDKAAEFIGGPIIPTPKATSAGGRPPCRRRRRRAGHRQSPGGRGGRGHHQHPLGGGPVAGHAADGHQRPAGVAGQADRGGRPRHPVQRPHHLRLHRRATPS